MVCKFMSNVSQNDNLNTAKLILKAPHSLDEAAIDTALHYLFSNQNEDGGWGGRQGEESNIFMTVMTIMTLQQFSQTTELANSIDKATGYLASKQNQDGGFGAGLSNVYDTALVYIVLAGAPIDAKILYRASAYLYSSRLENGSWNDDSYSTALALRALCCSGSYSMEILLPEKEDAVVVGPAEDASTDIPAFSGMVKEDISGQPGPEKDAEISGYPDTLTIVDQVEILNAEESREGGSAVKAEIIQKEEKRDDKKKVSLLARRKASAYAAQELGLAAAVHEAAAFDPQLSGGLPLVTPGSIIGKVFDDVSKGPVQDVSITLTGGLSAKTDSRGTFVINEVMPDTYKILIYKEGYASQSHEDIVLTDTTTEMRAIYLIPLCLESDSEPLSEMITDNPAIHHVPESPFMFISGVITDASTNKSIANVITKVLETEHSFQTLSDGFYTLSDINLLEFNVEVSASGYNKKVVEIRESTWGVHTIDVILEPSRTQMWIKPDQMLSPAVIPPDEDKQVKIGIRLEGIKVASAPIALYAITNTIGDCVTIAFDKSMADPSDKYGQFTVLVDDILKHVISAALNALDTTKIDLTLESPVAQGQIILLSYLTGDVESAEGNQLKSFNNQAVVNKVSAPIYNQGGFGFSGFIAPNPLGNSIIMTGYNQWPPGFYKSVLAFAGSIFDGQCVWMVPANADSVVKIEKDTGVMTGYNKWPSGFKKGNLAFAGGVFDGQFIWMIPLNADRVIKIDKDTGEMTGYDQWPSGFSKGGHAFAGGVFDGHYVWMVPSYADRVIKIDKDTGEMTGYNEWPAGFIKGGYAFASAVFDGQHTWMLPANADRVIKIDKDTGEMTGYNQWPAGFIKGEYAFAGGVFDDKFVWMVPYYADRVIKIDMDTGEMTGSNQRSSDFNKVEYAFAGAVFDGQNIWMIPLNADKVVKIDKDTDAAMTYNQWPAGFSKGINAFAGAVFDGQNIWMIPSYADKVVRLSSFSTISVSANVTANDTFYFYISQDEAVDGVLIGQGSRYSSTYSLNTSLVPGVTNYLHIKGTDSMGPVAAFIGDFTLNDDSFSFANGRQRLLTGEGCWEAFTDAFGGTKEKVTTICKNGMGKWATRFGIDLNAQWIWTKGGEDLATRYFSTPIYYSSVPIIPITDVKVINTIMQPDVVVNENSFTREPHAIEKEKGRTIVEWRFDRISLGQREDISFDVTLKKPVSGEDRLVSHNLEVFYVDAINKQPVHIELGSRFVHVYNASFAFTLKTDKEVYDVYEDIAISGIIKNLSEYSRTVDVRVVIGDSHGIPMEEVAVLPDLTFAAGEERDIGDIICNIGARYPGKCMAHLLLDENMKQVGETSTSFTINTAPVEDPAAGVGDGIVEEKSQEIERDENIHRIDEGSASATFTESVELGDSEEYRPAPPATGNTWDALSSINKSVIGKNIIDDGRDQEPVIMSMEADTTLVSDMGVESDSLRLSGENPEGSAPVNSTETITTNTSDELSGEGIIGAINVQINPVYQGLAETINYNIINNNDEDLKGFAVKVVIVDAGTQEIRQTFEAPKKHRKGKEFSGTFTFSTAALEPRIYLATVYVTSASITEPKPIESTTFEVRLINAIVV